MKNDHLIIGKRKALNNRLRQFKTIIDSKNGLYKIQESLLGIFSWGKFEKLPRISYVLVFKSFYAKCEACSLDEENDDSYYQVSLVYNGNRRIIVHESKKYKEVVELASRISEELQVSIKNSIRQKGQIQKDQAA